MIFFSKNACEIVKDDISAKLGISVTNDLGKYLRLPTINRQVTKQTFKAISGRVDGKLAGWKSHIISIVGRATLVQSTIASIPSYAMQTLRLPRSLCDEIDRKSKQFLWGGTFQTRSIHNVSWGQITKSKQAGGLSFRTMRENNATFLTKLGWWLLVEKDKLWSQVLRAKYCHSRCDISKFQPKAEASNTW